MNDSTPRLTLAIEMVEGMAKIRSDQQIPGKVKREGGRGKGEGVEEVTKR